MIQVNALLTFFLGLLFGITVMLFVGWGEHAPQNHGVPEPVNPSQGAEQEQVSVVVAAEAMRPNVKITAEMLRFRLMDRSEAPLGAFRSIEECEGLTLRRLVSSGQVILTSMTYPLTNYEIPPGYRVMTIPVEGPAAHLDAIRRDDVVDVFITDKSRDAQGNERLRPKLLLEGMVVFTVGDQQADEKTQDGLRSISLLVTTNEARLMTAATKGPITVEIRPKDEERVELKPREEETNQERDIPSCP